MEPLLAVGVHAPTVHHDHVPADLKHRRRLGLRPHAQEAAHQVGPIGHHCAAPLDFAVHRAVREAAVSLEVLDLDGPRRPQRGLVVHLPEEAEVPHQPRDGDVLQVVRRVERLLVAHRRPVIRARPGRARHVLRAVAHGALEGLRLPALRGDAVAERVIDQHLPPRQGVAAADRAVEARPARAIHVAVQVFIAHVGVQRARLVPVGRRATRRDDHEVRRVAPLRGHAYARPNRRAQRGSQYKNPSHTNTLAKKSSRFKRLPSSAPLPKRHSPSEVSLRTKRVGALKPSE